MRSGSPVAARALALVTCAHAEEKMHAAAKEALLGIDHPRCLDAVWEVWYEQRNPDLAAILQTIGRTAEKPFDLRVYSALLLDQPRLVVHGPPECVAPWMGACQDSDAALQARAQQWLELIATPAMIDALCAYWVANRDPRLKDIIVRKKMVARKPPRERVFTALKAGEFQIISKMGAAAVEPLLAAIQDTDGEIAASAQECLHHLEDPAAVDQFCVAWMSSRTESLTEMLVKGGYVAQQPLPVRIYSALKNERISWIEYVEPEGIEPLLQACTDADPAISQGAQFTLRGLKNLETQQALCQVVIERDDPTARAITLECGYEPREVDQKALFYFLTGQMERYEIIDFDRRLLRSIYETASQILRMRIARAIQGIGRTDFATVLSGGDYRSRIAQLTDAESEVLVRMLASNREWAKLWDMALRLPYRYSLRIVRLLKSENWAPEAEVDRSTFQQLAALSSGPIHEEGSDGQVALPPAVLRSQVRVYGRINDLAFSPIRPLLAIATGQRKVVLWDYEKAEIVRVITGFAHSINPIGYTPEGGLVFGERSSPDAECSIYAWSDDRLTRLGAHKGQVTSIEPLTGNRAITTGRDQQVILWDGTGKRPLAQKTFHFWPRATRISPDEKTIALLHEGVTLAGLPDLEIQSNVRTRYRYRDKNDRSARIVRSACFVPPEDTLLLGNDLGQVIAYRRKNGAYWAERTLFDQHPGGIQGIAFLQDHSIAISACSRGGVHFTDWASRRSLAKIVHVNDRLTSLSVSPRGEFMALGDRDASLSLWDLRVMDIPMLFVKPLAQATPSQFMAVRSLCEQPGLPPAMKASLDYVRCVLDHHFRFDIQVAPVPSIRPGEFDIIVEESGRSAEAERGRLK